MQVIHQLEYEQARSGSIPFPERMRLAASQMAAASDWKLEGRTSFLPFADPDGMPEWEQASFRLSDERIVWVYWDRGYDVAPELIRLCAASLRKHVRNARLIFLNDVELGSYISIPAGILAKWDRIDPTKRSDLIRLEILAQHGGIWLDATCFLTASLPERLFELDQFFPVNEAPDRLIRSWFIAARPANPVIVKLLRMHHAFYAEHTQSDFYFFFHYLFECLCMTDADTYERFRHQDVFEPSLESDACNQFLMGIRHELDIPSLQRAIVLKTNRREERYLPGRKEIVWEFLLRQLS